MNTCENCKHCGTIANYDYFLKMEEDNFYYITGYHKNDVTKESIMYNKVFYCYTNAIFLPKELICKDWEKAKE